MTGSRGLCSSCSKPVVWVKTEARGSQMPLDPKPHPEGNVVLVDIPQTKHQVARVIPNDKLPAEQPAYRSHFVTCPDPRRRPKSDKRASHCGLCSWSMVSTDTKKLRAAFAKHYADEHLDRCPDCAEPLLWIRTHDMTLLKLDPEPVAGGAWRLTVGAGQRLAAPAVDTDEQTYRAHDCPSAPEEKP